MSILEAGKTVLKGVYAIHKLAPTHKNRIAIISRQSNQPSVDIRLLKEELDRRGNLDVRVLCKTLDSGIAGKLGYMFHMLGPQMHAIATSKVVVLDSYCIAVSILKHKKDLKVIQMWHAMGALKKFGRSILGQEEGSSEKLAEAMDMHKGYDYILASSQASIPYFAEAFGYPEDRFRVLPLPRTDLLKDGAYQAEQKNKILESHPELSGRKIVLYAPTMRKTEDDITKPLALADAAQAYPDWTLVISPHPVMHQQYEDKREVFESKGALFLPAYSTMELLSLCDAVITDYSAVVYEAAAAEKPIYLFAYDLQQYEGSRGFYLDYQTDMPVQPLSAASDVMECVAAGRCSQGAVKAFADKFITMPSERCTAVLAEGIVRKMAENQ